MAGFAVYSKLPKRGTNTEIKALLLASHAIDDAMLETVACFFPDCYRDWAWAGDRLSEWIALIADRISTRRAEIKGAHGEPWADAMIEARLNADERLCALTRLVEIARSAEERGAVLVFHAD